MADIVARDPFDLDRSFGSLRRAMDRWFDTSWPPRVWLEEPMPLDVSEEDGKLKIEASLPGFDRDQIEVDVSSGVLTIKAHREEETEEKQASYYRHERRAGSVSRRLELPGAVADDAHVEAQLKNGVLTVTVPISEEAKAKRIEIKAG